MFRAISSRLITEYFVYSNYLRIYSLITKLCHSTFSYMFRPAQSIVREHTVVHHKIHIITDTTIYERRHQHWYACLQTEHTVTCKGITCTTYSIIFNVYFINVVTAWSSNFILFYLCTFTTIFYIKIVFDCFGVLPEEGLCRPEHVGEFTTTQQIVTHKHLCN
jgi:hypothetical protein